MAHVVTLTILTLSQGRMLWDLLSTRGNGHTDLVPNPAPTHSFLKRVYPGTG